MAVTTLQLKQFEEILEQMANKVRLNVPELTDWNVGSRIRTLCEMFAWEDDEQYNQIGNLLALWNLNSLTGRDLDERLAEWNITRRGPLSAFGKIIISNNNVTTSFLSTAVANGATSVQLLSSAGFPSTGTLHFDEGSTSEEDVGYTANNVTTNTLTLAAATTFSHLQFSRVTLNDGSPAIVIPPGTRVKVPATSDFPERTATITGLAVIDPGEIDSNEVDAVMDNPGIVGNVANRSFKEFVGGAPFDGASVRNQSAFTGGRDTESDEQLLSRGIRKLQTLARSTPLALEQLVIGEEYTSLGQTYRVISAKVQEVFDEEHCEDYVYVYIWPGSFGFITSAVNAVVTSLTANAEDGQKFFQLPDTAIRPNTLVLQRKRFGTGTWVTLVQGTDYFLNEGTGWIQIANPGLDAGDELQYTTYTYFTGLLQRVQTVLNGSTSDPLNLPGIVAAGVKALATYPRPKTLDPIRVSIQVLPGFVEERVRPDVANALNNYLTSLQIGQNIIYHEMIKQAMEVTGMYNVQFSYPTSDIYVLEDEVIDIETLDIIVS